jgi:gamma-glutamyltranspeptidase/glutathione hydrolase
VRGWGAIAAALLLAACTAPIGFEQPEAASVRQKQGAWFFKEEAVVAAHPLAARAGANALARGGNAVDAAVATQLMLALVEPQSSGIGGGGFLLLWTGERLLAFDGRETAPAAAREDQFLVDGHRPMARQHAIASGLAVGVPGLLRLLETVHARYGRLPWADVVQPAIDRAEAGFEVGPRLHELLRVDRHLRDDAAAAAFYFQADGRPWPVGHRLRNPALAALLRRVAREGVQDLYTGAAADDMVARVRAHRRPGRLSADDLRGYRVQEREVLCMPWLQWRLCGVGPPAAGALMVAQILALAGPVDLYQEEGLHRFIEAARLAGADRDLHVADPDFVSPPDTAWSQLLDAAYLRRRAALIGGLRAQQVDSGLASVYAAQRDGAEEGTTHLSVVDRQGMAVALTSSVESAFGSRILADGGTALPGGYFLNNQLTDFALRPRDGAGRPVANRVEPGKRPRSSMAPMMVFESGRLRMVLGSPGGLAIPHYVAALLLRHLDKGQPLQAAVDAPGLSLAPGGDPVLERAQWRPGLAKALRARGHRVLEADLTSGLHVLSRAERGWHAAADPRREGIAAGR